MSDSTLKVLEAGTGATELGAVELMQGVTPVKIGKQTIVDQAGAEVQFAKDASVSAISTSLGSDGATPPTIAGTGVRGWLRAIYDRLTAGIGVTGTVEVANDSGNPLPVSGEVSANLTKVNGAAHSAGNPIFADVTDRAGRNLGAVSGTVTANQGAAGAAAWPVSGPLTDAQLRATSVPVNVGNFPANQAVNISSGAGTAAGTPVFTQEVVAGAPVSESNPLPTRNVPANLAVQAQSAAAAAVTLTIPAAGPGLFHYIDVIEIHLYATAARTGGATPVTITSTNLPAALSWLFPSAGAIGTVDRYAFSGDRPMKSAVANTPTTIVAPAVTGAIVQLKAVYSVGP